MVLNEHEKFKLYQNIGEKIKMFAKKYEHKLTV